MKNILCDNGTHRIFDGICRTAIVMTLICFNSHAILDIINIYVILTTIVYKVFMMSPQVDDLAIVLSRFLFILDTRQGSCLDLTARILPDFQEYKILDRTDKSCPASQDSVYMILG
jgi:hypothetical protein